MNELEDLVRAQLHGAAERLDLSLNADAVLVEARRARTSRLVRRIAIAVVVLAVLATATWALWSWVADAGRRAVPNPLTTPSVEPLPKPSPSASATPSAALNPDPSPTTGAGAAAVLDLNFRDGTGKVRAEAVDGGVRFTGLDAGATRSATLDAPQDSVRTLGSVPGPGYMLAVLPAEATWAGFLDPDTGRSTDTVVAAVPGTDLVAAVGKAETAPERPQLVWGRANGRVYGSDGRLLAAAEFDSLWGVMATHFVDDQWRISGTMLPLDGKPDDPQVGRLNTRLLAVTALGGPDADGVEFTLALPRGAAPASVTWNFGRDVETAVARQTSTLPDGRTLVHEGFRAPRLADNLAGATASYTRADGQRVTAPIWEP